LSQNSKLLTFLQSGRGITQLEAFNTLGICRLSQRVAELEQLGWVINHESVKVLNRDGKLVNTVRYSLISEPARAA
jgi:hypothetical protein